MANHRAPRRSASRTGTTDGSTDAAAGTGTDGTATDVGAVPTGTGGMLDGNLLNVDVDLAAHALLWAGGGDHHTMFSATYEDPNDGRIGELWSHRQTEALKLWQDADGTKNVDAGKVIVAVISGGNVDSGMFARVLSEKI